MNLVDIKDYEGSYSFDLNTNQVWSHKNKKYLKPLYSTNKYLNIILCKNNITKQFLYHRLIYQYNNLDVDISDLFIDHIDRNKLNNNIENLRIVNRSENNCNRKHYYNKSTKIKNITLTDKNQYKVRISKNNKVYSKTFQTLEEAIEHKKIKLEELHGEYATD